MFNLEKLTNLSLVCKNAFPKQSQEIADAFEYLNQAVDDIQENLKKKVSECMDNAEYDKISEITQLSKEIHELQIESQTLHFAFECQKTSESHETVELDPSEDEEEISETPTSAKERYFPENIVYKTARRTNDFKGAKVHKFIFEEHEYEANSMKDVLVQVCSLLAKKDIQLLQSLTEDDDLQGRIKRLISNEGLVENSVEKYRKIDGTDLFVHSHGSRNDLKNKLWKLLKKFNLNTNSLKIAITYPAYYQCNQ